MKRPDREERRVNGPYEARQKWRLSIIEKDGRQRYESYDTKEAAEDAKRVLNRAQAGPSLWECMLGYFDYLERKGLKEYSVKTERYRLQSFFELDQSPCKLQQVPLSEITAEQCEALYVKQTKRMSVDTHRNTLTKAKSFAAWCVKQKWIEVNPLAEIEPIGRRKRGKEQLRVDEARKFMAVCQKHAATGDPAAVAAMTALLLGLRGSEVVERMVRDLDDGGRLLWIPKSKTEAGKRMLEVPESLRPLLQALVKGKQPTDRIFTWRDRHWLLYHVRRMCREAGVPAVTAHSLRGLHATLAMEHGSTGRVVAAALGHTSFAQTTQRHYVKEGTVERMAQRRVGSMLEQIPGRDDDHGEAKAARADDAQPVADPDRSTPGAPAAVVIRRPGPPVFRVIEGGAGRPLENRETVSKGA